MSAIGPVKPRRKPATYGKASGKHTLHYGKGEKNSEPAHYSSAETPSSDGTRTTGTSWSRGQILTDQEDHHSGQQVQSFSADIVGEKRSPFGGEQLATRGLNLPKATATTETDAVRSPTTRQPVSCNGLGDLTIFDVPSSSDSNRGRSPKGVGGSRKRRKANLATDDEGSAMLDDDGLQRHIALAAAMDRSSPCFAPDAKSSTRKKIMTCTNSKKSTSTSVTSRNSQNRTRPSRMCRDNVSAAPGSCGRVGREQQSRNVTRDQRMRVAEARSNDAASAKQPLTPVVFSNKSCREGQGIPGASSRHEPDISTPSTPTRDPLPAEQIQRASSTVHKANHHSRVKTDQPTAPDLASSQIQFWVDLPNDKVPAKPRVSERAEEAKFKWQPSELSSVRQSPKRIVDALNQHHSVRVQRPHNMKGKIGDDMESNELHLQSSSNRITEDMLADNESQSTSQGEFQNTDSVQSQTAPAAPAGGPKITYARQRSYLTEDDLTEADALGIPNDSSQDIMQVQRRKGGRAVPPMLEPLLNLQEEVEVVGASGGGIRSFHELREAGEKHQFEHDIETLLDDIDSKQSSSISQKRNSLLALATKLSVPEFAVRFAESGLERRLFTFADSQCDPISGFLLVSAILFYLYNQSPKLLTSPKHNDSLTNFLISLLKADEEVVSMARDRRSNMSKALRSDILSFRTLVEQSPVWASASPSTISAQVIALRVLEGMIRHAREAGDPSELLPQYAVIQLLEILELQHRKSEGSRTSSQERTPGRLALSILECCTMGHTISINEVVWNAESCSRIANLLPSTSASSEDDAGDTRNLILRLYLNLTNNNPTLCEAFSKPEIIRAIFNIIDSHFHALSQMVVEEEIEEEEEKALLLDNLILSLGSFINFAEWSDAARRAVLALYTDGISLLEKLLQVFLHRIVIASEASKHLPKVLGSLLTIPGGICGGKSLQRAFWIPFRTVE